jgi:hypothetical protein
VELVRRALRRGLDHQQPERDVAHAERRRQHQRVAERSGFSVVIAP